MFRFLIGAFAVAGVLAATGPIIIHLLNRRRFRIVEWAAMDFLRQAMQRNRRVVQLRDLILLVLRCLAVAVFGLALARPFVSGVSFLQILAAVGVIVAIVAVVASAAVAILASSPKARRSGFIVSGFAALLALAGLFAILGGRGTTSEGMLISRQPVHAVLIVDNSMSMGYESLDGTLLDQARKQAAEFIDALPAESRIHVIALCGGDSGGSDGAYRNKADARAALDRLRVVDRTGRAAQGLEQARAAIRQVPEISARRVVFLSDQQSSLWTGDVDRELLDELEDVQLVQIAPESVDNVWVSDFSLQDGIADTETPSVFLATIQHSGEAPLAGVQVSLSISGTDVASQTVDLEPGQARQVEFRHVLESAADSAELSEGEGRTAFLRAQVTVTPEGGAGDRLSRDNSRHLIVPVVEGLPVVFVDQYGAEEDLDQGDVGETYRLRRLLAPQTSTDEELNRQLIRVRHRTPAELDEKVLADARLVVIAGTTSPGNNVGLLRQFVEQGGSVVIAAGADFDPGIWQEEAWQDGAGILPAPLLVEPVGQLPEVAVGTLKPFYLDFQSLQHDFFLIEGESRESLEDLYRLPLFFKAVACELDETVIDAMAKSESERIQSVREQIADSDQRRTEWEELDRQGTLTDDQARQRQLDDEERRELQPTWLSWADSDALQAIAEQTPDQLAARSRPRVLGRYSDGGHPFLVERRIGAGRVLFVSSGLYSSWNTLTSTNAILMFDRILRQLLEEALPRRNHETGSAVTLATRKSDRVRWELVTPGDRSETLPVEALSSTRFGVVVRTAFDQGSYTVRSVDTSSENQVSPTTVPLAFNCPPQESELEAIDSLQFHEKMGEGKYRWLESGDTISVDGSTIQGRDMWKWMVIAVLVFLLSEMLILAWPHRRVSETAEAAVAA